MDPKNVYGISERLGGGCYQGNIHLPPGHELIPLHEGQVEKAVNALLDKGVEVIGILFLGESADMLKLVSMTLVIAGVVGLNLAARGASGTTPEAAPRGPGEGSQRAKALAIQIEALRLKNPRKESK